MVGATGLIDSQQTLLARAEGHDVVESSRRTSVDLTDPCGFDALIDEINFAANLIGSARGAWVDAVMRILDIAA